MLPNMWGRSGLVEKKNLPAPFDFISNMFADSCHVFLSQTSAKILCCVPCTSLWAYLCVHLPVMASHRTWSQQGLLATYLIPWSLAALGEGSGWNLIVCPAVLAAPGNLEICSPQQIKPSEWKYVPRKMLTRSWLGGKTIPDPFASQLKTCMWSFSHHLLCCSVFSLVVQ